MLSTADFRYYIQFLDDFSRFSWIYPLRQKSDALAAFNHFRAMVQNQFSTTITFLQSDNGTEYSKIHQLCAQLGIGTRLSCPYTSAQNGRVERKHRHIVETGLSLLAQASMPLEYWLDAFTTAVSLINSLPTTVLEGKSPLELLHGKIFDYGRMKIFGCACYPCLCPYQGNKFQYHTERCTYMGPSPSHKGYKCMNSAGRVFISRHVTFNETMFPFAMVSSSHSPAFSLEHAPNIVTWFPATHPTYFPS